MAAGSVPVSTPISSMKRPRPVNSAPSSTRSIERPTHGPSGDGFANDVPADCFIPMVLAAAFFGTRIGALFGDIAENGHTARSQNLPNSLISYAASHNVVSWRYVRLRGIREDQHRCDCGRTA